MAFFERGSTDRADEMRAHLDLFVEELVARGRTPEQARREARLRFGNPRVKLEELDEMTRWSWLDALVRDLRYAVRVLRRTPVFAVTAIVTLALAIGANTAVFSLADTILLRALPYPEPERLALIETRGTAPGGEWTAMWQDGRVWEAVRDHADMLDSAVYVEGAGGANLVVGDAAAFVQQQRVSAGYFRVLGKAPLLGREFTPDEDRPNGPAVTVLSHRLWQRVFSGDSAILGQGILLRGEPHTVVGVMPADFVSMADAELWTPVRAATTGEGGGTNFQIVSRLAAGAEWAQARAQLESLSTRDLFQSRGLDDDTTAVLDVVPLQSAVTSFVREPIVMLGAAVAAVLLIACVNLAALLLARGAGRSKEVATRMALGSGRGAVVRQLMTEAGVLALAGGACGLAVGYFGLEGLRALGGEAFSEWRRVTLDGRVVAVTLLVSLVTSVVFGLVPAIQASRLDVQQSLASTGTRSVAGASRHWPRRLLVVTEVALGVALLVTAGLMLRTVVGLQRLDPGFDPTQLVMTSVSLQDARYADAESVNRLFDDTIRHLREMPGVESAGISLQLPYDRLLNLGFRYADDPDGGSITNMAYVTPGFRETFRIPLRQGRDLTDRDTASAPAVVLVNDMFVKIYSPDQNPVGRRIVLSGAECEIVGVIGDVQQRASFTLEGMTPGTLVSAPVVLMPASQLDDAAFGLIHTWFRPAWTVRSSTSTIGADALREALRQADPLLPVADVESLSQFMDRATSIERLLTTLVGVLAGAALLLAAIGIHGLIAHSIGERRREFGIRMALGATARHTMLQVALGGLALAGAGVVVGGLLSLWAVGLVESFLWGVEPNDPLTYAAAGVFLIVVAAVASLLPASRILKLDPAATLRS